MGAWDKMNIRTLERFSFPEPDRVRVRYSGPDIPSARLLGHALGRCRPALNAGMPAVYTGLFDANEGQPTLARIEFYPGDGGSYAVYVPARYVHLV